MKENYKVGNWLEFYPGFRKLNFRVALAGYFDNRPEISFSLGWGQFYIHLPFIRSKYYECDPPEYGFYFYGEGGWFPTSFWLCLGRKNKCFHLPWAMEWVRTSALKVDGTWEHETRGNRKNFYEDKWKDVLMKESYPYRWTQTNEEGIQVREVIATIRVEEREWRPRWFKWTKAFREVDKSLDITFSEEIGKGVGSWKGGVTGCSWRILPGETVLRALNRMENTRKF